MILTELTSIGADALPIQAFKDHLRLGTGFAQDDLQDNLLELYLRTAIATIEGRVGLILIPRRFSWSLTKWRSADRQPLPIRPVSEIFAISSIDKNGNATVLDGDLFKFEPDDQSPSVVSPTGNFPQIGAGNTIEIVFSAGFGPTWENVPSDLHHAVLLLAAHFYENRNGTFDANTTFPMAVMALIERHRPMRLGQGV